MAFIEYGQMDMVTGEVTLHRIIGRYDGSYERVVECLCGEPVIVHHVAFEKSEADDDSILFLCTRCAIGRIGKNEEGYDWNNIYTFHPIK